MSNSFVHNSSPFCSCRDDGFNNVRLRSGTMYSSTPVHDCKGKEFITMPANQRSAKEEIWSILRKMLYTLVLTAVMISLTLSWWTKCKNSNSTLMLESQTISHLDTMNWMEMEEWTLKYIPKPSNDLVTFDDDFKTETSSIEIKCCGCNVENEKQRYITIEEATRIITRVVKETTKPPSDLPLSLYDFAAEMAGGQVISTPDTVKYHPFQRINFIFRYLLLDRVYGEASNLIQASMELHHCWAFSGPLGNVVIQLAETIRVDAISISHISQNMTVNGQVPPAPKEFIVYGINKDGSESILAHSRYNTSGDPRQRFPAVPGTFDRVKLSILSNHGQAEYTCVYRFQVFGQHVQKEWLFEFI